MSVLTDLRNALYLSKSAEVLYLRSIFIFGFEGNKCVKKNKNYFLILTACFINICLFSKRFPTSIQKSGMEIRELGLTIVVYPVSFIVQEF